MNRLLAELGVLMVEQAVLEKPKTYQELIPEELRETRLLTEFDHIDAVMLPDGTIPEAAAEDIQTNLLSAVYEQALPMGVSTSIHRVEYRETKEGQKERVITWLGRTAVENATSGYKYHFSDEAFQRVEVEVAEAEQAQTSLRPGYAQVFISPRMSRADAQEDLAKAEHLAEEDSVRTSFPITDRNNTVTASEMQSLLARDIPLEAWVAMLEDPNNILGKTFSIRDRDSALSVMEVTVGLEVPLELLPEGPVTIIREVANYIKDDELKASVHRQVEEFGKNQQEYRAQAEETKQQWYDFEIDMVKSKRNGFASEKIEQFIDNLSDVWTEEDAREISNHRFEGKYLMTRKLAAILERAKQNVINGQAAIAAGNEEVIEQMDERTATEIRTEIEFIEVARRCGFTVEEIQYLQDGVSRKIAAQNLCVGGGCSGETEDVFKKVEANEAKKKKDQEDAQIIAAENKAKKDEKEEEPNCKTCASSKAGKLCVSCQTKYDSVQKQAKDIANLTERESSASKLFRLIVNSEAPKSNKRTTDLAKLVLPSVAA